MRSIRLSLMFYFLALLATALGAASFLAYKTAYQTLTAKEKAARKLILAQYTDRLNTEKQRRDEALLVQAQTLARMVQYQFDFSVLHTRRLSALGLLSSGLAPQGYVLAPVWVAQSKSARLRPFSRAYSEYYRRNFAQLKLDAREFLPPLDEQVAEYYQIETQWKARLRSPSLGKNILPLDPKSFGREAVLVQRFDNITLPGTNTVLRRVTLKAPIARGIRFHFGPPRFGRWGDRNGRWDDRERNKEAERTREKKWGNGNRENKFPDGKRPPPPPNWAPPLPSIYIQCACSPREYDKALTVHGNRRDQELAELDEETQTALVGLRTRLLTIGLITFAATILGSILLVRRGLSPLSKLSDAVSKVSPRDFRLPLDNRRMPGELQPIAQHLSDTLDMLKRAFAREKQATADISHELRTPLAAMLTTTELALRKPRSAEQYREMIQECRLSAQQMNQAIERLLTLARLDAGVELLRPQTVEVSQLAELCAAVVRPLAEARGLRLSTHTPSSLALALTTQPGYANGSGNGAMGHPTTTGSTIVKTDPDKLREVLTNLLHNAIQYNQPGGSIDLTVTTEDGCVIVEVSDTGIGINSQVREQIFERFYRADPAREADDLHAGLGLAIVKEYVSLMGATIEVESDEGQGSVFRLRLPAA
jgi:signal transduction histidine kinase